MNNYRTLEIVLGLLVFTGSSLEAGQPAPSIRSKKEALSDPSILDDREEGQRPLSELLRDLKSKDLMARRKAACGLSWKSPLHELTGIPPLIEALSDENADVREEIAYASESTALKPRQLYQLY